MEKILNQPLKMGYAKAMIWIADAIGIPIWILGIVHNIDNIKAFILFLLGVVYGVFRIYYYRIIQEQKIKEKEYDLWEREFNKQEKIRQMNKVNGI